MQLSMFSPDARRRQRNKAALEVYEAVERAEHALRLRASEGKPPGTDHVMLYQAFFDRLCDHALRHAGRKRLGRWYAGRRRATPVELEMVVRRVVRDLYSSGEGVFAHVADRGGFITALLDFFAECREGNATADAFQSFISWLVHEGGSADQHRARRVAELTRLLRRYERLLDELSLLDQGLALRVALEALKDRQIPLPQDLQRPQVRFCNIYDWSPIRVDIVRELARRLQAERAGGVFLEDRVEIELPYDFDRPNLFHYLEPILRQVESLEGDALTLQWHTAEPAFLLGPLEQLAEAVWSSVEASGFSSQSTTIDDLDHTRIAIVEAPGPVREARAIARRVRRLLDEGAAPDEIVIAPRALDERLGPVCDALDAYRIPWQCRQGTALLSAAPARLALSILRLVLDNYPREPFIEIMTSRYTAARVLEGGWRRHDLAQTLREAGVRDDLSSSGSGRSAYEERLEGLMRQLTARYGRTKARRQATAEAATGEPYDPHSHPEVLRIGRICDRILWLRHLIAECLPRHHRHPREHARGLLRLLDELKIGLSIERGHPLGTDPGQIPLEGRLAASLARDQRAWRVLRMLLEGLGKSDIEVEAVAPLQEDPNDALPVSVGPSEEPPPPEEVWALDFSFGIGPAPSAPEPPPPTDQSAPSPQQEPEPKSGKISLGEFVELLGNLMARVTLDSTMGAGGSVHILPVNHISGLRVPHVILPGLVQGQFPTSHRSMPLFTDDDRIAFGRFEAAQRRRHGEDQLRMSFPLQCVPYQEGTAGQTPVPARQSEEVLLFYFGLSAATETLTLTHSTLDATGREAMRSVFLDEVLRRIDKAHHRQVQQKEPLDPVPELAECVSPWELAARYQLEAYGDGIRPHNAGRQPFEAAIRAMDEAGLRVMEIERAAQVERARHALSAATREESFQAVQGELGRFCGNIGQAHGGWLDEVLAFDRTKPLSASMLNGYGTCPQKFLFAHLMNLKARQVVSQDVTALDRHEAVQKMLAAAYESLDGEGLLPLGQVDDDAQRSAVEVAMEGARQSVLAWEEVTHRAHPRLWGQVRGLCEELVQQLVVREQSLMPQRQVAMAWDFGPDGEDVRVELAAGVEVYLKGRVDRVLRGQALGAGGKLEIIGYGTASLASYERRLAEDQLLEVEFGMPLAMLAVAEAMIPRLQGSGQLGREVMLTARYESLLEGKQTRPLVGEVGGRMPLADDAVAAARTHIARRVSDMRLGQYPPATRNCAHCQFRAVCRRGTYPEQS